MNRKENIALLKTQTVGVEIEIYGATRSRLARLICKFFKTHKGVDNAEVIEGFDDHGHKYEGVYDHKGKLWKSVNDGSLHSDLGTAELVSPVLEYDDISYFQELVRFLRENGIKSNADHGCGVHIHIGANGHTPKTLLNLLNMTNARQELIKKAIGFSSRRYNYSQNIDQDL